VRIVPYCSIDKHAFLLDFDFITGKGSNALDKRRRVRAVAAEYDNVAAMQANGCLGSA